MKEMIFMSAQPDDTKFAWQIEAFIENVRGLGYTNPIHVLIFLPYDRLGNGWNPYWDELERRYKDDNVFIFRYEDKEKLINTIKRIDYIPLLRPHILKRHFKVYPDLKEKAIFYHDSDIVFTKYLNFEPFLNDEINYLSNTSSYLNADYFDAKRHAVITSRRGIYEGFDVLDKLSQMLGVSRAICVENNGRTGGAQYLLKNIDSRFWERVEDGCITIRRFLSFDLSGINRHFFKSENEGFQSWCADMWAVLWTLWARGSQTETPPELDFCWATDPVSRWNEVNIYHDAGVITTTAMHKEPQNDKFLFDKSYPPFKELNTKSTPFTDFDFSHVSPEYASSKYVQHLLSVKDKYYK